MHPVTLQFDDEDMERELRSGTLDASYCALILFGILDILCRVVFPMSKFMFNEASDMIVDTSTAMAVWYTCIAVTYATVLLLLPYAHALPRHNAATFQDQLWMTSWVINVAVWWAMTHFGLARRLTLAEGQGAVVICAMWAFVMVLQHALHIGFRCRMVVLLMAVSIAMTSVAWQKELLAALTFGEAVGYSMEHMMRMSYLPRAKNLEEMRVAKERSDYDLQMLAHSCARSRTASPMRRRANSAQRSKSNSARSQTSSKASSKASRMSKKSDNSSCSSSNAELSQVYALRSRGALSAREATARPSARPPSLAATMTMRREASFGLNPAGAEAPPSRPCAAALAREQVLWRTLDACGLLVHDDDDDELSVDD